MDIKKKATQFTIVFLVSLLVTIVVTFFWNLIFHGIALIDWETSFRFAILFGIIFPIIDSKKIK